jgi:hypothetical protein
VGLAVVMILKVAVFGALEGVQQVLRTMVESSAISVVKLCAAVAVDCLFSTRGKL